MVFAVNLTIYAIFVFLLTAFALVVFTPKDTPCELAVHSGYVTLWQCSYKRGVRVYKPYSTQLRCYMYQLYIPCESGVHMHC